MQIPKIAIMMTSYRDTRFLRQQLLSISHQDHPNLELWLSRDCDTLRIGHILNECAPLFKRFTVLEGPRRGASANFFAMIFNRDIQADYYAYADHDDIWKPNKLSRAIEILRGFHYKPSLYTGRSELINADGKPFGMTPDFSSIKPSFRHALIQNLASGHTTVINDKARRLLCETGVKDVPLHDWWSYLVVSGAGGGALSIMTPSHMRFIGFMRTMLREHQQASSIVISVYLST